MQGEGSKKAHRLRWRAKACLKFASQFLPATTMLQQNFLFLGYK